MAKVARPVFCELASQKPAVPVPVQRVRASDVSPAASTGTDKVKIVLQPRLCTLRSYGSDQVGVMMKPRRHGGDDEGGDGVSSSPFFATLSEYIESSKKSQDFEIISGRLAMVVFAATVTMEVVTGNSLFKKMDLPRIAEAAGVCLGAVTCAAIFAWFSSARTRVGRIFTFKCNTLIDSLVDQIVDGLFYDGDQLSDWSDEP
ncbi:stress enhanced protein 2, chloroplastic [Cornus florida]|uniref:stress enhanced protein 2, chloroplastic n=1 Tax=Cornus florida TaxID=4283 RepID=UPI002896FADC|nr:stress enhanced protein 2, chloroplastic [Cornus florida]